MTTAIILVPSSSHAKPVEARPVLLQVPLSFWGGYDCATGLVIDQHHPDHGLNLAGCILMMETGRGSSSGSSVLAEAIRIGTAPAAILLRERDAIIVTGAIVAAELYNIFCPVLIITSETEWQSLAAANLVKLSCTDSTVHIEASEQV